MVPNIATSEITNRFIKLVCCRFPKARMHAGVACLDTLRSSLGFSVLCFISFLTHMYHITSYFSRCAICLLHKSLLLFYTLVVSMLVFQFDIDFKRRKTGLC